MAHHPLSAQIPDLPPDLVYAVALNADCDADWVGVYLAAAGLKPPLRLPTDFLLGLGAALRLYQWEQSGIHLHLAAGLPPAREALHEVLRAATGQAEPEAVERLKTLSSRVLSLFVERFAWNGRVELGADLTLDPPDEDALLDGLADFLWDHRPT
jgi:hypothetical protein